MDVAKMILELREERAQLEEVIMSLERLAAGQGRRRGRPPAWMQKTQPNHKARQPGRKGMSSANRKAQSERMKAYWAARRKAAS